jgi:hypothetical protein
MCNKLAETYLFFENESDFRVDRFKVGANLVTEADSRDREAPPPAAMCNKIAKLSIFFRTGKTDPWEGS